jgi:hypothetical protein
MFLSTSALPAKKEWSCAFGWKANVAVFATSSSCNTGTVEQKQGPPVEWDPRIIR